MILTKIVKFECKLTKILPYFANFLQCMSAKNNENWLTYVKLWAKTNWVLFETQCTYCITAFTFHLSRYPDYIALCPSHKPGFHSIYTIIR